MKKYIRSDDSAKIELPIIDIVIDIEYLIRSNIHASVDNPQNLPIADSSERHEVSDSFKTYMQSVVNVIESEGFTEIRRKRSTRMNGRSQTSYYMFCYENDFYVQKVRVIFNMRISNHELRMWSTDTSQEDANRRQEAYFREKAQDYKWLSDSSDPIDLVPVYITYEGDYIEKYNEILRDVRRRLQRLKSDFPSET